MLSSRASFRTRICPKTYTPPMSATRAEATRPRCAWGGPMSSRGRRPFCARRSPPWSQARSSSSTARCRSLMVLVRSCSRRSASNWAVHPSSPERPGRAAALSGVPVKLRRLGRTGLTVSEIGFGCGPTGGLLIRGTPAERREALACALDLGINYFDTAPGYGTGASESNLGETLQSLRASAVVATKVALDWDSLGDIRGFIERSVENSLRRLRRQEVDIIQLHNRVAPQRAPRASAGTGAVLTLEDVLDAGGVLEAFERLRTRGCVRFLGCSAFGGDMILVQRLIESGRIDLLTVHYSMLNRTAWSDPTADSDGGYRRMG